MSVKDLRTAVHIQFLSSGDIKELQSILNGYQDRLNWWKKTKIVMHC